MWNAAQKDIGRFLQAVEAVPIRARIISSHHPDALIWFHAKNFLTAQSAFHKRKSVCVASPRTRKGAIFLVLDWLKFRRREGRGWLRQRTRIFAAENTDGLI
jgi:hypothetical protein